MNENACNTDRPDGFTASASYGILCNLVIHAEQIRWARLNNFLIANSIFVLAWAAVFASTSVGFPLKQITLTWICLPGLISGLIWAALGGRSSDYLDLFHKMTESLEDTRARELPKPFKEADKIRERARRQRITSSRFIVTWVPVGFSLFYVGLIHLSWIGR